MNLIIKSVEKQKKPFNSKHRKEKFAHYIFKGYIIVRESDGVIKHYDIVDLRTYITPSGKHYVCLWAATHWEMLSSSASAGGYGYCKASTAAEMAFYNAGINFDKPWGGTGVDSIEEAIMAYLNHYTGNSEFKKELLYKFVERCYG